MIRNQILTNTASGDVIAMLSPENEPKRLYQVEGRKEILIYEQSSITTNTVYVWQIDYDLIPLIFWVYEDTIQANKTLKYAIVNPKGNKVFDVTLTTAQLVELGNTFYWQFPFAIIESGSMAYFQSSVDLQGINVLCTSGHIDKIVGGSIAPTYP